MAHELRIGDRVRTPAGKQVVIALSPWYVTTATRADVDTLYTRNALYPHDWTYDDVEPLPADIPRERVADLHAAVCKRLAQLYAACDITQPDDLAATCAAQRWSELSEVAEALRLLLELTDE